MTVSSHESSKAEGWIIPKQYKLDVSLSMAGYEVLPVAVIELCKPDHACEILREDECLMVQKKKSFLANRSKW
jgi:uncharacterized protein (DUF302 family)